SRADPASPVRASVYDGKEKRQVPGGVRDFSGGLGDLRAAMSYAVLRAAGVTAFERGGRPLETGGAIAYTLQYAPEINDPAIGRSFTKLFGMSLYAVDGALDSRALGAAFDRVYVGPK